VLENRSQARAVLRGLDVEGDPRRRHHLADDLVRGKGRALVMRVLAVLTVLLLILGFAPIPAAHAESPDKGQALGILVLAGLLKSAAQAEGRSTVQKPRPALQSAPRINGRPSALKSPKAAVKSSQARIELARAPH
jgi:hypothetical protein